MNRLVVILPPVFNSDNAREIINTLGIDYEKSMSPVCEKIIFDFAKCEQISPVGLLYIKMWRDELLDRGKETYYRKSDSKMDEFLRKMSLLPENHQDEQVSKEYFYSIHRCNSSTECSVAHREITSDVVQRGKVSEETYCSFDYMLNELWDNAGVHGYGCYTTYDYPKPVYICAWETQNHFELAIGDRGQGIYNSLKKKDPTITNKKQAVKAAIQNGITGHPKGSPGFGLFCSAEFLRKGCGNLHIWSSGCYLTISSEKDKIYTSNYVNGTLITLTFAKTAEMPFEEVVGSYKADDYLEEIIGGMFDE